MEKNINTSINLILSILFFIYFSSVNAQTIFTVATADGYATGTTGGGNASPVTVTTASAFRSAVESNSEAVIIVSGNLEIGSVNVNSNKTIIGADLGSTLTGNLALSGVTNIIIQNLIITNKSGVGTGDGVEASNECTKIFVHKCTFIDCADGSFDIKRGSTNITVSWCRFQYPTNTSHCFPNLIGHSDDNWIQDRGKLHVTMHHNWYENGCQQRMPRVRFGQVHVYNNFYGCPPTNPENDYTIGVGVESSILVENCYFENISNTWWDWTNDGIQGSIEWNDLCLVSTTLSTWATNSDVFDPPYTYSLDTSYDVKSLLTNSTYGAGNTKQYPDEPDNIIYTKNDTEIEIYPNPAGSSLQIKGIEGSARFMLFDLNGKLIITKEVFANEIIAVDALSQGVYILKIVTAEGAIESKLIKK
ncbi:MAG: T9SS type A sorting domain-containing protein [Bacteroidales bacterium]|nr:T9SS type A sorting domain-containing protein [Bacteroidales bacterium]